MHPRNPYKEKKPDFKTLAVKYEEFRKHATQDLKGAVHIGEHTDQCHMGQRKIGLCFFRHL